MSATWFSVSKATLIDILTKLTSVFDTKADASHSHTKNDITDFPTLGTAAAKDVPSSGNATSSQVVMGSDTRLSDARNAADVYAWAKAASKPTYTATEVGAAASNHDHPLSIAADSGTSALDMAANTVYKLTAGGKTFIFKTPADSDHYAWADITGKPSSYPPSAHTHTVSQITDFPSTMPPSSHTHGNIQNGGTLQTNDVAIANGDKLVVTDSSDSAKVARTSLAFDGSTATKCLTQKGTWENFTNNAGTITGIKMNGASKGTSGVVDLGTVITSHQDISGKLDKAGDTMSGELNINISTNDTPLRLNAKSGSLGCYVEFKIGGTNKGYFYLDGTDAGVYFTSKKPLAYRSEIPTTPSAIGAKPIKSQISRETITHGYWVKLFSANYNSYNFLGIDMIAYRGYGDSIRAKLYMRFLPTGFSESDSRVVVYGYASDIGDPANLIRITKDNNTTFSVWVQVSGTRSRYGYDILAVSDESNAFFDGTNFVAERWSFPTTFETSSTAPTNVVANKNYLTSVSWSAVTDKPSTFTPSSHTHGNLQNGGTLQTNDITIASGDKLVVTDSSDSSKIARASISFDGSTATKCLTQKGTWETFASTNTDSKVKQLPITSAGYYRVLLSSSADDNETTAWVNKPKGLMYNPSFCRFKLMNQDGTYDYFSIDGKNDASASPVYTEVNIGNSIRYNTSYNRAGQINLYGVYEYYTSIITNVNSSNKTIRIPDKTGTIALTSDLNSYVPLSGGTMTGTLINSAANAYICSYSNQHYMLRNDGNAWYFMSSATVGAWDKGYIAFDTSMNLNMCYHSIINQSDRRSKKDITLVDDDKLMNFYSQLKPSRFKFIDNKDDKYKYGFIAQDVEEAMTNSGISVKDKALIRLPEEDHSMGEARYSLSYNEFIPLNTRMIQLLTKRIEALESKLI